MKRFRSILIFVTLATSSVCLAQSGTGEACGGIAGMACGTGEFCKLNVGECCCDFQGICTPIPQGCPDVWDPVCGCDGVTHGNECEADALGVSIAHAGACEDVCDGGSGAVCGNGEFCKHDEGDCFDALPGVCTAIPPGCPDPIWAPVCGCDGVTYGNECEAELHGVSVEHQGECPQSCGGVLTVECPPDQFCKFDAGECAGEDGVCTDIPDACPANVEPVCGCDGVTYNNECEAERAGASVEHTGPCDNVCGGITGIQCGAGEYCKLNEGECCCDFQGVCLPIPDDCIPACHPVCGCDGTSYRNACEAAAAGVSVEHTGLCHEVPDLGFMDTDLLSWTALPGSGPFNLYRSGPDPESAGGGASCLTPGIPATAVAVPEQPPLGGVWMFLVTGMHPGGEGPAGTGRGCAPRNFTPCGGN